MSPLCIWTVHMSQGVHVWLLHGSISCTHDSENSPHLYKLKEEEKKMTSRFLQAILDRTAAIWKKYIYKIQNWYTNPTMSGRSVQTSTGNGLKIIQHHTQLNQNMSSGDGPWRSWPSWMPLIYNNAYIVYHQWMVFVLMGVVTIISIWNFVSNCVSVSTEGVASCKF